MKLNNKDFNKNLNVNFENISNRIDYAQFSEKKTKGLKKRFLKIFIPVTCLGTVIIYCLATFGTFEFENSGRMIKKTYSINEIKNLENNSFKSLNNVDYPSNSKKKSLSVDDDYVLAINNFANNINTYLNSKEDNVFYSPLSLYLHLDIISNLTDDSKIKDEFNNLLSLSQDKRNKNYINAYLNNFYLATGATTQIYNGLFVDNKHEFNDQLLSLLTEKYVETFSLNYDNEKDISKILKWADEKNDTKNMLSKEDLEIDEESIMNLISILYYKNNWKTKFYKQNTYQDYFYGNNYNNKVKFMKHNYIGEAYDYGTHYVVYDYYNNDYKIKYIVPKNNNKIDDILKNNNIFKNDIRHLIKNKENSNPVIKLCVPKIDYNYTLNFKEILTDLGLNKTFDENYKAFNYSFKNLTEEDNVYLKYVKQKNMIEFTEDGTIAKTVTFSGFDSKNASEYILETLIIKLDHPFAYIIEDNSSLPVYYGIVNQL